MTPAMPSLAWSRLIEASADPERVRHQLRLVSDATSRNAVDSLSPDSAEILCRLLAASRQAGRLLVQHPDWVSLIEDLDGLRQGRRKEGLQREAGRLPGMSGERLEAELGLTGLHELRQRELLRIAARDLARLGPLETIVRELSDLADVFLEGVLALVWRQHVERFGQPWHRDPDNRWQPTAFCVLGMGKLGGQELNYSSDVDLLFVYSEEGGTFRQPPRSRAAATAQVLPSHQFFKRLGEALIRCATERGVDGGALRIDMRLRPEGDSGPLARSLDSYENFYAEWGQTWERMMLLKARCVAGDPRLGGEFLEVVQPFRFPRSLGVGMPREMSEMKARIERDVVRTGELERNIKLGRGGIREVEFVAQALQVMHGGRNPFLQTHQTLVALDKLSGYGLLDEREAADLGQAYRFLRDVEHRLQMDEHRQTHTLPEDQPSLERLARLMGFRDQRAFAKALRLHTSRVREIYEQVLGDEGTEGSRSALPVDFGAGLATWHDRLASRSFRDPEKGARLFRTFIEGPGFGHISRRTGELGRQLTERFLELCPLRGAPTPGDGDRDDAFVLSDPDRVLVRLDSYIGTYGARASLYELWTARPNVFEHILKLFDRSEFLAELAVREPDLVDELEAGGHLGRQKDADQTLADLRHGLDDPDQHLWVRRYFQTEFMRLGLRDILGHVDFEQANRELSSLAEACVQYAVEVVMKRHRLREAPFAIIGLGKFGGAELVYGSDLDLIFVAPDPAKHLPRWQKLAGEVIDLLSARTPQGTVFVLDTRLRPDGEKGLLVNGFKAHEEYYRQRAMLWEIQALTRARRVAGHPAAGAAFEALARTLTNFRQPSLPLTAFRPDWKSEVARMRLRIERERTPKGLDTLAFKTGPGGLVDAEFLAQALAMEHGWFEPNTVRSLEKAHAQAALVPSEAEALLAHFRQLRRMESILRRWSFEGEAVLPEDPAAQYRVAVRCGYRDTQAFFADLARWRTAVRQIYARHLPAVS